jgi:tetratricopeptide (TPR) repeat protein
LVFTNLFSYKALQRIDEGRAKTLYDEINTSYATPDNDIANLDLGISFWQRGQDFYVDALRAFRRAVLLKPDLDTSGRAHYLIGAIYKDQKKPTQATGEFEQAAAAYQRAIRLNPRDAESYYRLGWIDVELGRKADALRVYKTLQSIDPAKAKELYGEISKK